MNSRLKRLVELIIEAVGLAGLFAVAILRRRSEPRRLVAGQAQESSPATVGSSSATRVRPTAGTAGVVLAIAGVIAAILLAAAGVIGGPNPGPRQPVPFSHHLHATTKGLSCFFCHPYAGVSTNAGIPPVGKCLLCHKVIASNFRPIANLRGYYDRRQPVPWVRVAVIPDFVHFSHECHIVRGVDCSVCHGDVKTMDRVTAVHRFDMNFCVTCHWKYEVTTNCFLCHY